MDAAQTPAPVTAAPAPSQDISGPSQTISQPQQSYTEQYMGENVRPVRQEAPEISKKRRLLAAIGGFTGGFSQPGQGGSVAQHILNAPAEAQEAGYQKELEQYQGGLSESYLRDKAAGETAKRFPAPGIGKKIDEITDPSSGKRYLVLQHPDGSIETKEVMTPGGESIGMKPSASANDDGPPSHITTDKGIMGWNEETQEYDTPLGQPPEKPEAGTYFPVVSGGEVRYWNPKTNQVKEAPGMKITSATQTMGETANALLPHVTEVRQMIRELGQKGKLGPLSGRYEEFITGRVGGGDPEYARLRATMALLQTGMMRAHVGARGGVKLLEHFKTMWNTGQMTPEVLEASLDAMDSFLKTYAEAGGYGGQGNQQQAPPPSPGPGYKLQKNNKTGEYRWVPQ